MFIDLSKVFGTADHATLLRKLELYGITVRNYPWIHSYLSNRMHYIQVHEIYRTEYSLVKCGEPQIAVLGPLLFLLYVNDLKNTFPVFDLIVFADGTNLLFTHSEVSSISLWFATDKLSLNAKKTKYSFFHKTSKTDEVPLTLKKVDYY